MSRKLVALSVQAPRRRRQQQKRWRHNDDVYDEDVENQQPSPHPMSPIILPQSFLHAPNTFKPVSHIRSMNNTSSIVLNIKKMWFTACVHAPKPKLYLFNFVTILFPYIVPNPERSRAS